MTDSKHEYHFSSMVSGYFIGRFWGGGEILAGSMRESAYRHRDHNNGPSSHLPSISSAILDAKRSGCRIKPSSRAQEQNPKITIIPVPKIMLDALVLKDLPGFLTVDFESMPRLCQSLDRGQAVCVTLHLYLHTRRIKQRLYE